jgi:hypothetical protein
VVMTRRAVVATGMALVLYAATGCMPSNGPPSASLERGPAIDLPPKPNRTERAPRRCKGVRVRPEADLHVVIGDNPEGTTFCLPARTYRITQPLVPKRGQRLIGRPGTVISGARLITSWEKAGDGVWVASGQTQQTPPSAKGFPSLADPSARLNEDVFMDDRPLRPVSSRDDLRPGTFYFDFTADQIHIADAPSSHIIEAAAAPTLIRGDADDVVIQGLVLEKAAGFGIQAKGTARWRIENNEVRLNHQIGVCSGPSSRVLDNFVHHQGQMGLCGSGKNIVVKGNEIAFNNLAGYSTADGGCWDAGGAKWVFTVGLRIADNYVHDNRCHGLWTDINNINTVYEHNWVVDNAGHGIFHEISYDAVLRRNLLEGNELAGAAVASSPNVVVTRNIVRGNGDGIVISQQGDRGSGLYGPHLARNIDVTHNVIVMKDGHTGAVQHGGYAQVFAGGGNRFARNMYYLQEASATYWAWDGRLMTREQWTSEGHDKSGRFYQAKQR